MKDEDLNLHLNPLVWLMILAAMIVVGLDHLLYKMQARTPLGWFVDGTWFDWNDDVR